MSVAEASRWMRVALRESVRSVGRTHPNPPVGCAIVKNGALVGRGGTQAPPGPHAEVVALRQAGDAARGATLYTTLEPCNHHGRTPPCTEAIIRAGIQRVVVAVRDPHAVASGGLERLEAAGIKTLSGICSEASEHILAPFLHWARTGTPYVALKSAMTLDGKIASHTGASRWITGPVARAYVHRLRSRFGAVLTGIGTALADDPLLTTRHAHSSLQPRSSPVRIIVDSRLRLPLDSRLAQTARLSPLIVACTEGADEQAIGGLRALGAEVLALPAKGARVDPAILMRALGSRGISGILVESGGDLAFSLLESGCVNEVLYFIAPLLLGGGSAPTPLGGVGFNSPGAGTAVEDVRVRRCGADWVVRGCVARRA